MVGLSKQGFPKKLKIENYKISQGLVRRLNAGFFDATSRGQLLKVCVSDS